MHSPLVRGAVFAALFSVLPHLLPAQSRAQAPAAEGGALPLKYAGPPTVPEITAGDLMTRLYLFADDSMMGRAVGTEYNDKGTAYIERELRRFGLQPAGDGGSFFQKVPVAVRALDSTSTITVEGATFRAGVDFIAANSGALRNVTALPVVYGGMQWDTLSLPAPDAVRGKALVLWAAPLQSQSIQQFISSAGYQRYAAVLAAASVIATVAGEQLAPQAVRSVMAPTGFRLYSTEESPITLSITRRVSEALFGAAASNLTSGTVGRPLTTDIRFADRPVPARNVIALLPGSDPKLRHQYVAIGAHSDHVGPRPQPVDHDSLRAFNAVVRPQGADSPTRQPTADEWAQIRSLLDSARRVSPPRLDSIHNGADDDGSGSMTVLEIAEAFARASVRPKRSILFVWHTGEERGLWGASHFTANPTVPRDSIVAQLNMDMVGRGRATDVTGESKEGALLRGGPGYVQLIGSRRLSTELGDIIERVNKEKSLGLSFDYANDADGHPQNIYCRSDHYEYARFGIPVVFLSTGGHADYHQVTDEPQYIDYPHMAQVARFVFEVALSLGNLPQRPVVDKPKPDPKGACVQ